MVSGERVEIGAVVDLGQHTANMMIAANKAKPASAPKPEPAPARRKPTHTAD